MRVLDRFRRTAQPAPPPPPPPYTFADPSAAAHSEIAASLVPPVLPRRSSHTSHGSHARKDIGRKKGLSALPLSVLHRICEFMLVVPRGWDEDADAARARAALYALRGVDRRFFLVITSILRTRLLPTYLSLVTESSDPIAAGSEHPTLESVFAHRSREGAVLDRFLAIRTGFEQRRAESALSEDCGDEEYIFTFLQPAARIEDLLLNLPPQLISSGAHAALAHAFPLPHTHVSVGLSSRWVQIYLHSTPVQSRGGRSMGRTLVAEVKRRDSAEATVERIGVVLEAVRAGRIPWGSTRIE